MVLNECFRDLRPQTKGWNLMIKYFVIRYINKLDYTQVWILDNLVGIASFYLDVEWI